jgi:hypothetical protein
VQLLGKRSEACRDAVSPGPPHQLRETEPEQLFPPDRLGLRGIAAVVQEVMVNIDFHRAGLGAGAAE